MGKTGFSNLGWLVVVTAVLGCGRWNYDLLATDGGDNEDFAMPELGDLPPGCDPLPATGGTLVAVTPEQASQLAELVAAAAPQTTFLLAPGTYDLSDAAPVIISTNDVALRSSTGDPADVILNANFEVQSLVQIDADRVVIADMTLREVGAGDAWYPGTVAVGVTASVSGALLYNLRLVDSAGIAVWAPGSGGNYADNVEVACSEISLSAAGRAKLTTTGLGCARIGGIRAKAARRWLVRDNFVDGMWCNDSETVGMNFYRRSRDIRVVRNRIRNAFAGIRFGLSETQSPQRTYSDEPACASLGYVGAMEVTAYNNIIYDNGITLPYWDSGIVAWQACDVEIVHNTIATTTLSSFSGIEIRFSHSAPAAVIGNAITDLTSSGGSSYRPRDGAPDARVTNNVIGTNASLFIDASSETLAPAVGSPLVDAGDCSQTSQTCESDYFGRERDAVPDVGAIEAL